MYFSPSAAHSSQWYSWGPAHMQCRLCSSCWIYWKKYGGLKMPTRLDGERPTPNQRQGIKTILIKSRGWQYHVFSKAKLICLLMLIFFSSRENCPNKLNENAQVHYCWMWKGKIYRDLCLQSLTDCVVLINLLLNQTILMI